VRYSDSPLLNNVRLLSVDVEQSNDFWGTGPRIGFCSRWHLPRGLSLLTSIAGNLTLGPFDLNRTDRDSLLQNNATTQVESHYHESFWVYRPMLECLGGISWDTCFGTQKSIPFGVDLSYELEYLWEQNMMSRLVGSPVLHLAFPSRGDLWFQGITCNFRVRY
jgi:hypothetical protein